MAEKALTRDDSGNTSTITWTGLANGDTGAPLVSFDHADMSAQVDGTFGVGGSVTLQGSNDGANWYALTDPQGNAITKTAAGLEQATEIVKYVRPSVTAGDGTTSLTVVLFMRRGR
ncbi:hypothetical protein [Nitrosovibrio sp. Nv4]|uniref:hypothetical protein n=1 Tax=Nitrosovibrio sp. Nv4 TaxID=1945880 RepID=UPI000BC4673C|nr:hypothetical protein [Nitrosovibrio sp. Nv4]SOD41322.1 hypothetical protein SAMN06298226_1617 [Nitrosovibrio sp. Nv4]